MANNNMDRLGADEEMGAMVERKQDAKESKKGAGKMIDWDNRIGRRNWIIVGAVLLIGLAVWLNWMFFSDSVGAGLGAPRNCT